MRHKMITLCLNSFEIAQKMPNFSSWVRKKILEDVPIMSKGTIYRYECRICKQKRDFLTQEMAWECNKCNVPLDFVTVIV